MALLCIIELCLGISWLVFVCLAHFTQIQTRRLRQLFILYLVLMTSVPPTTAASPVRPMEHGPPDGTAYAMCISQCKAKYWRRFRRPYYQCNWHYKDIWDKSGARQWYRTCAAHFCVHCQEFASGCHLFCCIAVAPVLFFVTCCVSLSRCMLSRRFDFLRCASEMIILSSLWQGRDTNAVAVGAWACWLMGLHCGRPLSCRAVTWLAVCLAQREVRILKLVFLTSLIYVAPLFGKRAGTANYFRRTSKISRSTLAVVADFS